MATPGNYNNEPQLNGPQHEVARQTLGHNQGAPQPEPPPKQPPTVPGADKPTQAHTIKLQRPPLKDRSKRSITQSLKIRIGGAKYSQSMVEELSFCARRRITKATSQGVTFGGPSLVFGAGVVVSHSLESGHPHIDINQAEANEDVYRRYIVVGIIGNEKSIPHETLLPILASEYLFKQIRKAERLWYMINPNPGEDYVAIVQTAWTIASYIVTTTALVLAVIASITQFGDI